MSIPPGAEQTAVAEGEDVALEGPAPREGKSPTQIALERLRKDKIAIVCLVVITLFVLMAIFQTQITNIVGVNDQPDVLLIDPTTTLPTITSTPDHPLGVEPQTGRDLFYRWVHGARPSLLVGIFAATMTLLIGITMGLLAGFLGGWVDRVISWWVDFLLSLPFLIMAFAIVPIAMARFGSPDASGFIEDDKRALIGMASLISILVIFGWPSLCRLIRGEVLSLREREFVQASRALGAPSRRVLFKEMLPNLLGPIIVNYTVMIPAFISIEAGLSFLGIGLQPPTISWGQTIASAQSSFETYPIYMWVPTLSIALLVLALSLFGDAVSDAFNPQTRR